MGLFITNDGHYQSWLAALLCCCAALDVDEHPNQWSTPRPSTREGKHIYQTQPPPTQLPPYPYHTSQVDLPDDKAASISSREDSHELLGRPDFGSSSLLGRKLSDATKKTTRSSNRPAIGVPLNYRRFDHVEAQRHSLIPLKLAPVTLRSPTTTDDGEDETSPLETVHKRYSQHQRSDSTQDLLPQSQYLAALTPPLESYRLSRESPFQRLQRHSTDVIVNRQSQVLQQQPSKDSLTGVQQVSLPLSTQSSANSLRKSAIDDTSSIITSRSSNNEPVPRVKRKHSGTLSLRGDEIDPGTDRDAIELNTIHEEHKPESPRPNTARSEGHVPAVAPLMQVPARSETLNDIGSVFSRPLVLKDAKAFDELLEEPDERQARPAAQVAKLRSRSSSRVSGWLSSIRTPSTAPMAPMHATDRSNLTGDVKPPPRPIPQSRVSRSSSVTAIDSPSLTTASSPVSKRHSRSLTAESRITSPPSTIREVIGDGDKGPARSRDSTIARTEAKCEDEGWPSLVQSSSHSPSQVGLAF